MAEKMGRAPSDPYSFMRPASSATSRSPSRLRRRTGRHRRARWRTGRDPRAGRFARGRSGLLQDGEPVVVVAGGAVGPHVMKPLRQLAVMRARRVSSSRVSAAYSALDMTTPVGAISREVGWRWDVRPCRTPSPGRAPSAMRPRPHFVGSSAPCPPAWARGERRMDCAPDGPGQEPAARSGLSHRTFEKGSCVAAREHQVSRFSSISVGPAGRLGLRRTAGGSEPLAPGVAADGYEPPLGSSAPPAARSAVREDDRSRRLIGRPGLRETRTARVGGHARSGSSRRR